MKAILPAALIGALMVSPAFAGGAQKGETSDMSRPGMSGQAQSGQAGHDQQTIRQVQQHLQQQGYQVGEIDGKLGPQTKQALQNFQRDKSLSGSGELDQQTIAALGVEPSASQQAETPAGSQGSGLPGSSGIDSSGRATTNTNSSDMNSSSPGRSSQ